MDEPYGITSLLQWNLPRQAERGRDAANGVVVALPRLEIEVDDGALELSHSDSGDLLDEVEDGVHLSDGF